MKKYLLMTDKATYPFDAKDLRQAIKRAVQICKKERERGRFELVDLDKSTVVARITN